VAHTIFRASTYFPLALKMTHLGNVQEVQQRTWTGMGPITAAQKLLDQILDAVVQEMGLHETEKYTQLYFQPARCGPVRRARYFAPALRGNITQQLGKWGKDGALTEKLADKVPKFDRDEKEVEHELYQHLIGIPETAIKAFEAGVLTEQAFLKDDLSKLLEDTLWERVKEAREIWRQTTMVELPSDPGQQCLLFVYRCGLVRKSAEETEAAVSQNTDTHSRVRICDPLSFQRLKRERIAYSNTWDPRLRGSHGQKRATRANARERACCARRACNRAR